MLSVSGKVLLFECLQDQECGKISNVTKVRQDVMNGKKYQELFSKGWLKEEDDFVTFLVNTDGVLLYTSSGIHLWSIYIALNEIPPEKR